MTIGNVRTIYTRVDASHRTLELQYRIKYNMYCKQYYTYNDGEFDTMVAEK